MCIRDSIKAGYGFVPVLSLNVAGLEKHPGFKLTLPMLYKMLYAVLYGDLLMTLRNQCKPYEIELGASEELANSWALRLAEEMRRKGCICLLYTSLSYYDIA